jgi:nitrogenase-stabilizing/protective protein
MTLTPYEVDNMSETDLELDMDELSSAEDFLEYFNIEFDPKVVHVNRLHILQRFHNYIAEIDCPPTDEKVLFALYADLLRGAYEDFVKSDAVTEKVFKVFHMHEPQQTFVPLTDLK